MERPALDWRKSTHSGNGVNCVEVAHAPAAAPTPAWRKATYSGNGGANCVEVGRVPSSTPPAWRKASFSGNGVSCVETGTAPGVVLVRDTKAHGTGPVLRFTPESWTRFTASIKH